jgi:hypothetical protein
MKRLTCTLAALAMVMLTNIPAQGIARLFSSVPCPVTNSFVGRDYARLNR